MTVFRPIPSRKCARKRGAQRGYALLMVIFFTALLLISTMVAAPRILTEGKREKEAEMIWRGKQYVRGVKLYYRKMGRFPTSLDDLTKPKTGSLRFMRQAYKDPMSTGDGTWRLIYVGPAGQLIGSLKPPQTLQLPTGGPGLGTPVANMAGNNQQQPSAFGSSSFGNAGSMGGSAAAGAGAAQGNNPQAGAQPPNADPNAANPGQPGAPGQPGQPTDASQAGTDANGAASADSSTQQGSGNSQTPEIIGGNIIGVGSKASGKSFIVYEKAKNYHLFEFIWDPSKDTTIAGQPLQTGPGLGQPVGNNPSSFGQQPGVTNQTTQPGATANPQQNNPNPQPENPPLDSNPPPQPEPQQ
jgi:hypothetical protein